MASIYAASLTLSQGSGVPHASATVLYSEGGRQTTVTLEWPLPTPVNADGNAGEWLYAMLSRVVQDFDEHDITGAASKPCAFTQEGINE